METTGTWDPEVGDVVTNRRRIWVTGSSDVIPKKIRMVVIEVRDDGVLQVRLPNGLNYGIFQIDLAFLCRGPSSLNMSVQRSDKTGASYVQEIRSLATLRDDGLITEKEFQARKSKLLV